MGKASHLLFARIVLVQPQALEITVEILGPQLVMVGQPGREKTGAGWQRSPETVVVNPHLLENTSVVEVPQSVIQGSIVATGAGSHLSPKNINVVPQVLETMTEVLGPQSVVVGGAEVINGSAAPWTEAARRPSVGRIYIEIIFAIDFAEYHNDC